MTIIHNGDVFIIILLSSKKMYWLDGEQIEAESPLLKEDILNMENFIRKPKFIVK